MTWLAWFLVILVTTLVLMIGAAILTGRDGPSVDRLADPLPLPDEFVTLPDAGSLPYETVHDHPPGELCNGFCLKAPFAGASQTGQPPDTGPLLILSEKMAANAALEREIRQRCAEAEAKIPPRWR